MQPVTLSLIHVLAPPRQTGTGKPPLLLMLHGVGANEQDLLGLAHYADPRLLTISLRAPRRYSYGGFSWFDIHWQAGGFTMDIVQIEESWRNVQQFIREAVVAYDADPQQVYLIGFSQGAIISLGATLTAPELVAGLVVMSGRWMPEVAPKVIVEAVRDKPIMVTHGSYDQVIAVQYGQAIRDYLQTLPVQLTYKEYGMGHEVSLQSISDISAWLTQQLNRKA